MLGILMVWTATGTVGLQRDRGGRCRRSPVIPAYLTVAALLIFCGAVGKSRAIPAARLVAGRDGRPDAGLRADPRRDDGGRRRLHAGARRVS